MAPGTAGIDEALEGAEPMRILHLIPGLFPGDKGAADAVAAVAAMNAEDGMSVTVAFGAPEGSVLAVEREWARRFPAVSFRGFPYSFPSRFEASVKLIDWLSLNAGDFDLMHAHSVYALMSLQACSVAISAGLPYVLRSLGSLDPHDLTKKSPVKYHVFASWVERILKGASFVQCTGRQEEANLETFGARPAKKILPLPAVAPEFPGDGSRFRRYLGIGPEAFVFLFLSQLDGTKGLELLFPAMVQAATSEPDAHLVIAGSGEEAYLGEVISLAAQTGLSERIHFTGFVSGQPKADLFAGSDCFVFPPRFENDGAAVLEALGYGLPALVSDQVQIWQEIVEARAGWVCKGSSQSLAAVMSGILADRSGLPVKSSWARTLAREFEPQNLRSLYRATYEAAAIQSGRIE